MPRVGVHAIIENESNQVLLVKRSYLGRDWAPPGGMMEDGESIPAAIAREVLEETGYEVDIGELIALGSRPATNDVIVVVEGRIKGVRKVEIALSEIETADFFSYDKLPEPMKSEVKYLLELYRRGVRGQLLVIEPSGSD